MRGVGICALLFVTREALLVADEGQQQCEYEYHGKALDRITGFTRLTRYPVNPENLEILLTFDFGSGVHELLHAGNHHKLERAIRLRGLLDFRQTLLAPVSRWRHAEFQIR